MAIPIPKNCRGCGELLLLENINVDDGCPCNSPRGVNLVPKQCTLCGSQTCVKPAHHIIMYNSIEVSMTKVAK